MTRVDHPPHAHAPTTAEMVVDANFAFDRGSFFQTLREKDSGLVVRERGHYLWLYVRRSEGWKLSRVIWNGGEEVQDPSFDLENAEVGRIQ